MITFRLATRFFCLRAKLAAGLACVCVSAASADVAPFKAVRTPVVKGGEKARAPNARPAATLKAFSADKAPHQLNAAAAKTLLAQGVKKLVFVRRFTLANSHVYTTTVLHRMDADGTNIRRLSNNAVSEFSPS